MHLRQPHLAYRSCPATLLLLLCAACGGGGGGGGGGNAVSLESISISPGAIELPYGFTLQLNAIGHYSDNTTQNLTAEASWTSADLLVATVDDTGANKGLLSALTIGTTIVTATFEGLVASRAAEVIEPVLAQLDIQPSSMQMAVGALGTFHCSAFYVGGYQRDVTDEVVWSTSDPLIAAVSNAPGSEGEVTALATGAAEVLADHSGFHDSAAVTVIAVEILDQNIGITAATSAPVNSIDASAGLVSLWAYEGLEPGRVHWSKRDAGGDWSNKQSLPGISAKTLSPRIASNQLGVRFAAWSSATGVWATRYEAGLGWETPLELDNGNPSSEFATQIELAVFENGDAWIAWQSSAGNVLRSKLYTSGSGWGSTVTLGSLGSSQHPLALAQNENGELILLWQDSVAGVWTLYASRYTQAGGLESPVVLYSSTIYHQPAIAMDSAGNALALFVDFTVFPAANLLAVRYVAGGGWEVPEVINSLDVPREPAVALDDSGAAFAFWRHATVAGTGLSGASYVPGTGWEERVLLKDSPGGAPIPLHAQLDGLGGIVAYWQTNSAIDGTRLELVRFVPGVGWEATQTFDFIGAQGPVQGIELSVHKSGQAIVTWVERLSSGDVIYAHRF